MQTITRAANYIGINRDVIGSLLSIWRLRMRLMSVETPHGQSDTVMRAARKHSASNVSLHSVDSPDGPMDLVWLCLNNQQVQHFIEDVQQDIPDVRFTLIPRGVIAMQPPISGAPDEVTDIQMRSPIEVFIAGLQSVGTWTGFLGYAAAAGVVVWIGLFTETVYLLTAAMLLAPFAGPAMNAAIATARGDWPLLRSSLGRYFAALSLTIAVTGCLSLLLQQEIATGLMVDRSQISVVAILLPLVAGIAGALHLMQSEQSSLVSGAAVGMLVAASLAPPAGVIGMAAAIGEWTMCKGGIYLLGLQLLGINFSGAAVFRIFGLSPNGVRYTRGSGGLSLGAWLVTFVLLIGLVTWQMSRSPELLRSSQAQRATATLKQTVEDFPDADLLEANARFTRANIPSQHTLLAELYVQPATTSERSAEAISRSLTTLAQDDLMEAGFNLRPYINVTVLEPPSRTP